ncbi:peptidoglycan editing factor PgeF [Candidatus Roizmanbacteria bacterium]|nr:peptidoglycan editing factor PgeF [Candidatus Roizmanbacteria bacterium]
MILFNPNLKIFYSTKINDANYYSGFSTRAQNDARNLDNIVAFFKQQFVTFNSMVTLEQIHSTNTKVLDELDLTGQSTKIEETDGVITKQTNLILLVRNADCVPLIFADKSAGIIGISHQGWRGSLKKMAVKMVDELIKEGAKINNLQVAIGPAIGACCYDVDEDRYYSFLEEFDGYSDKIFSMKKGRWHLNLSLLNYLQLMEAGVKKDHIDFFPFCTKCDHRRFFSRRRAGSKNFPEMFNFIIKLK